MAKRRAKATMSRGAQPRAGAGSLEDSLARLDLGLAWQRVKADLRGGRMFVEHPHLISWIEQDLAGWLTNLQGSLLAYNPQDCATSYVPRERWLVRPGAVLSAEDAVVFYALVGSFHEQIWKAIGRAQGDADVAYQFQRPPRKVDWLASGPRIWEQWRTASLAKLKGQVRFVLFSDISAFYENIDLSILHQELRSIDVDANLLKILMHCLNRWVHRRGKGIPQGYSASDILAKLYLAPIDLALRNNGFKHLRYVDDIRIFCRSEREAKLAIMQLNDLVRRRGLNLQTAKTEVLSTEEAHTRIDGVRPIIQAVMKEMSEEGRHSAQVDPYGRARTPQIQPPEYDRPTVEVLERAFNDHIVALAAEKFDRTLFRFLLTRLGYARSAAALDYGLQQLLDRPEETDSVLRYFSQIDVGRAIENKILRYARSSHAIYDYQLYQIIKWFFERQSYGPSLVKLCREWVFDLNRAPWLRTYSLSVLGAAGDAADLDRIEANYGPGKTEIDKAEIVAAVAEMEVTRRNAFYSRVKNDGELVRRAVQIVRSRQPEG